jgi:hypothetical protein
MHDCTYGALCIHCTCGWLRERERQRALLDPELLHNESESEREREREREREKEILYSGLRTALTNVCNAHMPHTLDTR